jgi:prepilin-type N-terminal cleavage/methylation domain-containing protein
MANPCDNRTFSLPGGVTLLELIVAMFIASIVISLALTSWTFISRHTTLGKHKSEFHSQAEQTASRIVNAIRTSESVLFFDNNSILFIAGRGVDTISFTFDGDTLRENGDAVRFVTEGAKVVRFSIEKDAAASAPTERPILPGEPQDIVLTVILGMLDRTGASSEIPGTVKIRYAPQDNISSMSTWNF